MKFLVYALATIGLVVVNIAIGWALAVHHRNRGTRETSQRELPSGGAAK